MPHVSGWLLRTATLAICASLVFEAVAQEFGSLDGTWEGQ